MKKYIFASLIVVLTMLLYLLPVSASEAKVDHYYVADHADLLTDEQEDIYEAMSEDIYYVYGLTMHLVTVEDADAEFGDIYDATYHYSDLYDTYTNVGVVLLIDAASANYHSYDTSIAINYLDDSGLAVNYAEYFANGDYGAFVDEYYRAYEEAVHSFYLELEEQQAAIDNIVVSNVMDTADLLTDSQEQTLQQMADEIRDQDMMEVYILTMQDFTIVDGSQLVEDAAMTLYTDLDLGYGENKDGVLLLLSMDDRDYSYVSFGDRANEIYSDSNKIRIENSFLNYFGDDDWYNGFYEYVRLSGKELNLRWYDHLFRILNPVVTLIAVFFGVLTAVGVANKHKKKLKSIVNKNDAVDYVANGGINITVTEDTYTHTTTSKVRIQTSSGGGSSGGGRSFSGGGFSGRSGKF